MWKVIATTSIVTFPQVTSWYCKESFPLTTLVALTVVINSVTLEFDHCAFYL